MRKMNVLVSTFLLFLTFVVSIYSSNDYMRVFPAAKLLDDETVAPVLIESKSAQFPTVGQAVSPMGYTSTTPTTITGQNAYQALPTQTSQYPVITPAAPLSTPVSAITRPNGQRWRAQRPLETLPGTRIVGKDTCGCPKGQSPCLRPCKPIRTLQDDLEEHLDAVKTKIVAKARKIQRQRLWTRQVNRIVRHYSRKLRLVRKSTRRLKSHIKALFAKKKHLEDLLLQYQMNKHLLHRHIASNHQSSQVRKVYRSSKKEARRFRRHKRRMDRRKRRKIRKQIRKRKRLIRHAKRNNHSNMLLHHAIKAVKSIPPNSLATAKAKSVLKHINKIKASTSSNAQQYLKKLREARKNSLIRNNQPLPLSSTNAKKMNLKSNGDHLDHVLHGLNKLERHMNHQANPTSTLHHNTKKIPSGISNLINGHSFNQANHHNDHSHRHRRHHRKLRKMMGKLSVKCGRYRKKYLRKKLSQMSMPHHCKSYFHRKRKMKRRMKRHFSTGGKYYTSKRYRSNCGINKNKNSRLGCVRNKKKRKWGKYGKKATGWVFTDGAPIDLDELKLDRIPRALQKIANPKKRFNRPPTLSRSTNPCIRSGSTTC